MPVAATTTVGFFSTARRIASSKVTRSVGVGACALATAVGAELACPEASRTAPPNNSATARAEQARPLRLGFTLRSDALDHHIQHRDEQQVEERRRQHP